MPCKTDARKLYRHFFVTFTKTKLRRLGRHKSRFDGVHLEIFGEFPKPGFHDGGVDVANDHENEIVRHVHFFVVADHIVARNPVVDVRVADDREPVGMRGERGAPEQQGGATTGVIHIHRHFAEDDLFFLEEFGTGNGGVHHAIGQNIHSDLPVFRRQINVVHGLVEGSISVHVAAGTLDIVRNGTNAARGGAFEKHVFQNVRNAGPEIFAFGGAAGAAPRLRGDDRRAVVFTNENGQTVVENGLADRSGIGVGHENRS